MNTNTIMGQFLGGGNGVGKAAFTLEMGGM